MNASLATADRGTHLKTILVAGLFSFVALGLAANMTGRGLGTANHPDGIQAAGLSSPERAWSPSMSIATTTFAAVPLSGNHM